MRDLKLLALDAEDLSVIAAHLQDAVLTVGDIAYLKRQHRFALVVNRFDWSEAVSSSGRQVNNNFRRRRTGVHFDRVTNVKVAGLDPNRKDTPLSLLTISFDPTAAPGGFVTLQFSGGAAIRLEVECVEAAMQDLGAAWSTRHKPSHAIDENGQS